MDFGLGFFYFLCELAIFQILILFLRSSHSHGSEFKRYKIYTVKISFSPLIPGTQFSLPIVSVVLSAILYA